MSVFDEKIDAQHQKLLNQVNVMLSSILGGKGHETVHDAINFLDKYIFEHLAYEEVYMSEHKYPDIENHKKMHRDFIEHYKKFKKNFEAGASKEVLALDIEQYIGNWWIEHIGVEDKKYALFVKNLNK